MSEHRQSIWDHTASFWIGMSFVAELPFWLVVTMAPDGSCANTIGLLTGCPVPVWLVLVLALLSYGATAYLAHRLGLGD